MAKQTIRNTVHLLKLLTLASTISALSISAEAEVYKWTDKNGNTHYSDIKPNEIKSQKLNIKTSGPSQQANSPSASVDELEKNKAKSLEQKAEKLQNESRKSETEAQCQNIRDNLKTIAENSRIKINENGETRFLSPEEIESKKATLNKQYTELCSGQ